MCLVSCLEREPFSYVKGDGKITPPRPFLLLDTVAFNKNVKDLQM